MFRGCTNFNGAIGNWDVSNVTNFSQSLMYCPNFNQPLDSTGTFLSVQQSKFSDVSED